MVAEPEGQPRTPRSSSRGGSFRVSGRAAHGEERARLWARWQEIDENLDGFAARRPTETAVVVLEPVPATP